MKLKATVLIIFALIVVLSCTGKNQEDGEVHTVILEGRDGRTVFDILIDKHLVDYIEADKGIFIESIDGIENAGGHYWTYSINGKPGRVACDKAFVSDGDTIRWEYK